MGRSYAFSSSVVVLCVYAVRTLGDFLNMEKFFSSDSCISREVGDWGGGGAPPCAFSESPSCWKDRARSRCCLAWPSAFLRSEEDILSVDRLYQARKMQTRIARPTNAPTHAPITVPRGMLEELVDAVAASAFVDGDTVGDDVDVGVEVMTMVESETRGGAVASALLPDPVVVRREVPVDESSPRVRAASVRPAVVWGSLRA